MGKLEEAGSRLGLSGEDIDTLMKQRRRWGWLIGIGGVILAVIMFFLGLILGASISGNDSSSGDSYPFAVSAFGIGRINGRRISRLQLPVLFVLGFLTGFSKPVFGNGVRYGVYNRTKEK